VHLVGFIWNRFLRGIWYYFCFPKKKVLISQNVDGRYRQLRFDQMDCLVVLRYRMEW